MPSLIGRVQSLKGVGLSPNRDSLVYYNKVFNCQSRFKFVFFFFLQPPLFTTWHIFALNYSRTYFRIVYFPSKESH